MKRATWITMGVLLLVSAVAAAQSLGDVARANRKAKLQPTSSKKYDNDNLPAAEHLSVVGQDGSNLAGNGDASGTANNAKPAEDTPAKDPKVAAEERDKANAEWQKKIDEQKAKVAALTHEIDLMQREYRLKAVEMYSDAGNRLRNSATWDKEDRDYKQQIDAKQKELDAAKSGVDDVMEQARKAGVPSRMRE